jgi:hypothetical protein
MRNFGAQPLLFDDGPRFTNRHTRAVTFKGKMALPIHRWYRLTPSFSPDLADDIAEHFGLDEEDVVLDPFSGVGTVPLCMKYRGVPAWSIELNPFLHFVGVVKTRTYADVDGVEQTFNAFLATLRAAVADLPPEGNAAAYLAANQPFVPPIHHVDRWWSPGNLMQLTCLRRLLLAWDAEPQRRDLLWMGALGILVAVSNAKHNHVSLTFADTPLPTVDVAKALESKYREMVADLREVKGLPSASATVYRGNSKDASKVLPSAPKVSAVITSPPYPNRFSYARETRPHLFFHDFVSNASAVGEMETDAIGGTWGKATSVLTKGVDPANDVVGSLLAPYVGDINGECNVMAAYVTKYFNDLYAHAAEIAKVCRRSARLAYVIGNSKFFGHPLPSDEILASIFGHFGFALDGIERMRRRQSKTGLYEAVVFMSR